MHPLYSHLIDFNIHRVMLFLLLMQISHLLADTNMLTSGSHPRRCVSYVALSVRHAIGASLVLAIFFGFSFITFAMALFIGSANYGINWTWNRVSVSTWTKTECDYWVLYKLKAFLHQASYIGVVLYAFMRT